MTISSAIRRLALRLPPVRRLYNERRAAQERLDNLRRQLGEEHIKECRRQLTDFEPHRAFNRGRNLVAHVNYSAARGGAALIARALHDNTNSQWASAFHSTEPIATETVNHCSIPNTPLDYELQEYGRSQSLRGFCGNAAFDLVTRLEASDVTIAHLHNLHPDYFNLFALPKLTDRFTTIWTLHDEYAFTGHCGATMECNGWQQACRSCPYVTRYLEMSEDQAHRELTFKGDIYAKSKLTVVCVSDWLACRVKRSVLQSQDIRTIYNGIDTNVFHPRDRQGSRARLGLPPDKFLCGYMADNGLDNPWKGGDVIRDLTPLVRRLGFEMVEIGGNTVGTNHGTHSLGYLNDPQSVAAALSSLDLFVYPTRADSFGLVVAEAMGCGIPVVASDVGAMPELIHDGMTGTLVAGHEANSFARAISTLAANPDLRNRMGEAARQRCEDRFSISTMLNAYSSLYTELATNQG